jgi:ABC-type lipoprotein release transport system permease subunit
MLSSPRGAAEIATSPAGEGGRAPPAPLGMLAFLALRTLREHRLSLALLLLAIAAGVGFQVPTRANLAGYRTEILDQQVTSGWGHVRVRPRRGERLRDAEPITAGVRGVPGVREVQPVLMLPGWVAHGAGFSVVTVMGVGAAPGQRGPYQLAEGGDLAPGDATGVLLGRRLAQKLGAKLGDEISLHVLLASQPRLVLDDGAVGTYVLQVRGLMSGERSDGIAVRHELLARELGEDHAATLLVVNGPSASIEQARATAREIERLLPTVTATAWLDDSPFVRNTGLAIDAMERAVDIMSLLAVSIPVMALLYIDALQRRRQISLLAAMGLGTGQIFVVFLLKALLIGAAGVLCGGLLGAGLLAYRHAVPIFASDDFVIRAALSPEFVLRPMVLVFLVTVLAGAYPAWRAARVDPSAMLRRLE